MIGCRFEDGAETSLRHVVADVIVWRGTSVLLVRRAAGLIEEGKWGLIGGFVERDERIVDAVRREVLEEVGWTVGPPQVFRVKDDPSRAGEDRQNVAFVWTCEADKRVGAPDDESDDQRWWDLAKLPPRRDIAFDHADDLALYSDHVRRHVQVPIFD